MYRILKKEMLSPAICRMKVLAPRVASSARPGQFLIVIPEDHGERVPLTVSDYDPEAGTVTIVESGESGNGVSLTSLLRCIKSDNLRVGSEAPNKVAIRWAVLEVIGILTKSESEPTARNQATRRFPPSVPFHTRLFPQSLSSPPYGMRRAYYHWIFH